MELSFEKMLCKI